MCYTRGGICWRPYVKGLAVMVNSIYNGWRMELESDTHLCPLRLLRESTNQLADRVG
jgi:hypothetical protein